MMIDKAYIIAYLHWGIVTIGNMQVLSVGHQCQISPHGLLPCCIGSGTGSNANSFQCRLPPVAFEQKVTHCPNHLMAD